MANCKNIRDPKARRACQAKAKAGKIGARKKKSNVKGNDGIDFPDIGPF